MKFGTEGDSHCGAKNNPKLNPKSNMHYSKINQKRN